MDCFVAFAPLRKRVAFVAGNDNGYSFAVSRRIAPEVCMNFFPPSKTEGAGNAGCLLHPRSRVQCVEECAHEHTGTVGALRHSLRNGLTAYALPGERHAAGFPRPHD